MRIDSFEKGGSKKRKITEPITRFIHENVDIDCTPRFKKNIRHGIQQFSGAYQLHKCI